MTTPVRGRVLELPLLPLTVSEEGPVEHLRNALQILTALRTAHPALTVVAPELSTTIRRTETAVLFVEARQFHVPGLVKVLAAELALEALLTMRADWEVITELRGAAYRLIRAWMQIKEEVAR